MKHLNPFFTELVWLWLFNDSVCMCVRVYECMIYIFLIFVIAYSLVFFHKQT